jgi:hypothetical protein
VLLTSDSIANFREIKPAIPWCTWIPSLLHGYALYYDSHASEGCDNSGDGNARPNKRNLDFIPHNSKQKYPDSRLPDPNDRKTGHLAEQLVFHRCVIDVCISDISV